jgi:hypothetical protein
MSKFTNLSDFKLPELPFRMVKGDYDFSKQAVIDGNIAMLKSIKNNYGTFIKKWADAFELGEPVLSSFIAVESGGKMVGKNSAGAMGLTQVTYVSVIECVSKFKTITSQDLPEEFVTLLKAKAPFLLKLTPNNQTVSSADKAKLEKLLVSDANFNIAMGALSLRWILELTKAKGLSYLHKGIIGYNAGSYGRISAYKNQFVSADALFKDSKLPKETRNYIVQVLGKNGFMELYVKNNI